MAADSTHGTSLTGAILRWGSRTGLIAWAGFWAYFVSAHAIDDFRNGTTGSLPHVAAWLVSLTALVLLAWRWPRIGGPVLVAAGVGSALYFPHPGAQLLLSLPAAALGVALFLTRDRGGPITGTRAPTPA